MLGKIFHKERIKIGNQSLSSSTVLQIIHTHVISERKMNAWRMKLNLMKTDCHHLFVCKYACNLKLHLFICCNCGVRGQLAEESLSLPDVGPEDWIQATGLGGKCLHSWRRFTTHVLLLEFFFQRKMKCNSLSWEICFCLMTMIK